MLPGELKDAFDEFPNTCCSTRRGIDGQVVVLRGMFWVKSLVVLFVDIFLDCCFLHVLDCHNLTCVFLFLPWFTVFLLVLAPFCHTCWVDSHSSPETHPSHSGASLMAPSTAEVRWRGRGVYGRHHHLLFGLLTQQQKSFEELPA